MSRHTRKYVTRTMLRSCESPVIVSLDELGGALDVLDAATVDRAKVTVLIDSPEIRDVMDNYRWPMTEINRRVGDLLRGRRR